MSPAGDSNTSDAARSTAGAGNARRFTFPFGRSGNVFNCTNACGTMYEASFRFRNSRIAPMSSGFELAR